MTQVKIFGERNSGTNYLHQLLERNASARILNGVGIDNILFYKFEFLKDAHFWLTQSRNLGWKHRLVDAGQLAKHPKFDQTHFITLTKHPASFLLSLYKNPYHYHGVLPKNFSEFLRSPWKTRRRENMNGLVLKSPLELWNRKNRAYLDLKSRFPERTTLVKYEDVLINPQEKIWEILKNIGVPARAEFENIEKSTKADSRKFEEIRAYYLDEKWRKDIEDVDIQWIAEGVDRRVADAFGYTI